ncbi:MAG: HAMP domain-containing protein, partial [Gammaproteobacteria bacterium]|nr:HAMP domain-containing protein [Gammaproteobacteria bacterium]
MSDAPEGGGSAPAELTAALAGARSEAPENRRFGVGPQIYSGLLGSVLLVIIASFVAYYFLTEIVRYQSRLAAESIPNLSQSVEIARQSAALVNGAARMASAATPAEHQAISEQVLRERDALMALVEEVGARSSLNGQAEVLETGLVRFGSLLEEVYASSARRLTIEQALDALVEEFGALNRHIEREVGSAIDDQGFFLVEGLRTLDDRALTPSERASEAQLAYYRDLVEISQQATLAGLLLGEALSLSERDLLGPVAERFRSAGQNLRRALNRLDARIANLDLAEEVERLVEIGESEEGVFTLRRESLRRLEQEREALATGREASAQLLADMERLVEEVRNEAVAVNTESQATATQGILWLVLLNVLSIIGAVLIGWLFVGRYLLRRLVGLAGSMREMASGDLEVPVGVSGNDEVTDMANALEVFRRYALEVQRLNLIEKLAEELDAKNQALEKTLEQLKRAQEQIVAEEKLASLGQLAAGVAHEIKNPLNFVKNFTEVSAELIDEIGEIID